MCKYYFAFARKFQTDVTLFFQIRLIEGINNDTIVSCMVAPNHLFLQQPTHPTFPNLNILSGFMNACYADANSPMLPNPMPGKLSLC